MKPAIDPNLHTDLNCDMGEGMEGDEAIFPFITSANIACGSHAGDKDIMRRSIELALLHGVAIGAHPSYPDRAGFGRIDLLDKGLKKEDLPGILTEQLETLRDACHESGARLHHIKLHGAFYNRAARDPEVAALICRAIAGFDAGLLLYGLSGSILAQAAAGYGLIFVQEVFADRGYGADGQLVPRTKQGALLEDPFQAAEQALALARSGSVVALTGDVLRLQADTICIHGDAKWAAPMARAINQVLRKAGIILQAPVF